MIRIGMSFLLVILSPAILVPTMAIGEETYRQAIEVQPVIERGAAPTSTDSIAGESTRSSITQSDFIKGKQPTWIWGADDQRDYELQTRFEVKKVVSATLRASCDNVGTVFLNGKQIASSQEWQTPMSVDVTNALVDGENILSARVANQGGVAAFVLKLVIRDAQGNLTQVVSDENWTVIETESRQRSQIAARGAYGKGPWGSVLDEAEAGRMPNDTFEVPAGFQVEKLFTVPKDKLGSWVCIAFDGQGRLLASDQGDKGICRITLPTPGSDEATLVEPLDFSKCEFQPSGAQGILWAFDALYFSCNGGPGSGLYRARDTDGDDTFDECVRLRSFAGGGEHGPHSLRLSPDGQRIFVIAGNHTQPPFRAGEEEQNENYTSRLPTRWGEDLLLPRMWDANGHARGIMAPGGWIASTDADGKTWEMFSIGYRNPYDMAFNADGELLAYDADMEWDVGAPWYRPTRIVHATSGSEFGWRSGTGKWPSYQIDSLPETVDIGPGSPVGVDFGYGLKFPAKYQRALYVCDWTFGTMYAIHLTPSQSSYQATKEEFVARVALPLTDCAAGADGCLYFTVGGRNTQSELFRVRYVGDESTAPAQLVNDAFATERGKRQALEAVHVRMNLPTERTNDLLQSGGLTKELEDLVPWWREALSSDDRYYRNAAVRATQPSAIGAILEPSNLNAIEGVRAWHTLSLAFLSRLQPPTESSPEAAVDSLTPSESNLATQLAGPLCQINPRNLSKPDLLNHLRVMSLFFLRAPSIARECAPELLTRLDPLYPSGDDDLDRELCQVLVYLDSPTVVAKSVAELKAPPRRETIDMGELLTRNRGYGNAIKDMIDNQPDKRQMWLAFCLRVAKVGWTAELRSDYFRWFVTARTWSGGNSFRKFLDNIEEDAWQNTSFDHRVLVEKAGARQPYQAPELPKPSGPGMDWTLAEVQELAAKPLRERDYENGRKMFAATRCVLCHRFAGEGGATGPDLTQLAGRFDMEALTEAIMEPSKVISDQYQSSLILTADDTVLTGRIVSETETQVSVLTDPEDSTQVRDVPKSEIEEIRSSSVSIMPKELLKELNRDEILDLLAYLLSRGNEKDRMFR